METQEYATENDALADELTHIPSFVQVKVECVFDDIPFSDNVENQDSSEIINNSGAAHDTNTDDEERRHCFVEVAVEPILGSKNETNETKKKKIFQVTTDRGNSETESETDVEYLKRFTCEMVLFSSENDPNELIEESEKESARSSRNRSLRKRKIGNMSTQDYSDGDNVKKRKERKRKKKSDKAPKKSKQKPKTLQCGFCEKQFTHASFVEKHLLTHGSQCNVKCLMCNKSFTELQGILDDTSAHYKEKLYICQSCGRQFRRAAYLHHHELRCRRGQQPVELLCTYCGKQCRSKSQLQTHTMCHTDERPFPCSHCSKRFRFKARLEEHERTHLGIKPHVCSFCNKTFTTSSDMKKHERRHEKPGFKTYNTREINPNKLVFCSVCDKKVINLKTHMYLHYEQGNDTCKICGKVLKSKSLYQHIKIHLEGMPYECDVCKRTFNRRHNMMSHRARHMREGYTPKIRKCVSGETNYHVVSAPLN